jgi:hypothetical protein
MNARTRCSLPVAGRTAGGRNAAIPPISVAAPALSDPSVGRVLKLRPAMSSRTQGTSQPRLGTSWDDFKRPTRPRQLICWLHPFAHPGQANKRGQDVSTAFRDVLKRPERPKPFLAVQSRSGQPSTTPADHAPEPFEADTATSTRIDSDPSCGRGRWYSLAVLVRFTGCSRLRRRPRLGLSYCYGRSSSSPWPGASRLGRV